MSQKGLTDLGEDMEGDIGGDIGDTEEEISMDDCMEVVYSFKCKFCAFTTGTPQGITSHVRAVHLKNRKISKQLPVKLRNLELPALAVTAAVDSPQAEQEGLVELQAVAEPEETVVLVNPHVDQAVVEELVVENATDVPITSQVVGEDVYQIQETPDDANETTTVTVTGSSAESGNQVVEMVSEADLNTFDAESQLTMNLSHRAVSMQRVRTEDGQIYEVFNLKSEDGAADDATVNIPCGTSTVQQDLEVTVEQQDPEVTAEQQDLEQVTAEQQDLEVTASEQQDLEQVTAEQQDLEQKAEQVFTIPEADSMLSSEAGGIEMVEDSTLQLEPITKELYVCGQCNEGFGTMDNCKQHMADIHNISFSSAGLEVTTGSSEILPMDTHKVSVGTQVTGYKKPGRKRKRKSDEEPPEPDMFTPKEEPSSGTEREPVDDVEQESNSDDEREVTYTRSGRRALRLPVALREDYMVSKRKYRKRGNKTNSGADNLRCQVDWCKAKFVTAESLAIHKQCHDKEEDIYQPFVCPHCQEKYPTWRSMRMHLWKTHTVDLDLLKCSTCDYRTHTACKLELHEQTHSKTRPYTCAKCGKGFKQSAQLNNHMTCHMREEDKPANSWYSSCVCDICGRKYCSSKSLKLHIKAVHKKVKPFICPYCGHSTARKAMLQLHIRTHTGDKPFKCDLCTYITSDHNTLRRHRMRHTGQKPYSCTLCAYTCIQAISLKTHVKNKHPDSQNEGIFECKSCHYRTVSAKSWENHLKDHSKGLIQDTMQYGEGSRPRLMPQSKRHTVAIPPITAVEVPSIPGLGTGRSLLRSIIKGDLLAPPKSTVATTTGEGMQTAQIIYSALNAVSQQQHEMQGQGQQGGEALTIVLDDDGQAVAVPEEDTAVQSLLPDDSVDGDTGTQTVTVTMPFSQDSGHTEEEHLMLAMQPGEGTAEQDTITLSAGSPNAEGVVVHDIVSAMGQSGNSEQLQGILSAIQNFQETSGTNATGAQVITLRDASGNEHVVTLTPLNMVDEQGETEGQVFLTEAESESNEKSELLDT